MELSLKSFSLLSCVLLTGLSAGLFCAWSISVIPGTLRVDDGTYLTTMQSINRAILNPLFFVVFLGTAAFQALAGISHFQSNQTTFLIIMAAILIYLIGTIGVTGLGNVPLNNQLDTLNILETTAEKLTAFRENYEQQWNRWHQIRTICALLSFALTALALYSGAKPDTLQKAAQLP